MILSVVKWRCSGLEFPGSEGSRTRGRCFVWTTQTLGIPKWLWKCYEFRKLIIYHIFCKNIKYLSDIFIEILFSIKQKSQICHHWIIFFFFFMNVTIHRNTFTETTSVVVKVRNVQTQLRQATVWCSVMRWYFWHRNKRTVKSNSSTQAVRS